MTTPCNATTVLADIKHMVALRARNGRYGTSVHIDTLLLAFSVPLTTMMQLLEDLQQQGKIAIEKPTAYVSQQNKQKARMPGIVTLLD